MTEVAEPSTRAGRPARAPRRGAADLPFSWVDRALVESIADATGEPGWLREDRLAALAAFESLPVESNRLYTPYVDLRAASLEAATPYAAFGVAPAAGTPDGEIAGQVEVREDRVASRTLDAAAAAAGVRLVTLAELVATDEPLARELLEGAPLLPRDEKLAELSRAAWGTGLVVHVPAGVRVARPIVLRWSLGAPRSLVGRTLIVLGDGAEATVVEELVDNGETAAGAQALFAATTEIRLGAGAKLAMTSLQELGPDHVVFQQRLAEIGEGADLRWALAQLGGRLVRSRVDNVLAGDRSTVEQVEIVFGADDQLHDLTSHTRHLGRDTTGQLLSKGVLFDRARSYMKGLIQIEKTAIGTDSYLGEFGMNLSKAARAVAIPSLEIDQPDCRRAMHSSSVGPIDPLQLFYLESRGIHPDEARKFIVLGFLEPVVARVPLEEAQDRLRAALEAKWAAGLAAGVRERRLSRVIDLVGVDEIEEGEMRMVWVDQTDPVLVVHVNGDFHALQGTCSHEYFELDKGFLTAGTLTCALHLSRFDLTDGEPLDPPAELPLAVYPVEVRDGRVTIDVDDGPLELHEEA